MHFSESLQETIAGRPDLSRGRGLHAGLLRRSPVRGHVRLRRGPLPGANEQNQTGLRESFIQDVEHVFSQR